MKATFFSHWPCFHVDALILSSSHFVFIYYIDLFVYLSGREANFSSSVFISSVTFCNITCVVVPQRWNHFRDEMHPGHHHLTSLASESHAVGLQDVFNTHNGLGRGLCLLPWTFHSPLLSNHLILMLVQCLLHWLCIYINP